jgi:hypothetical protein
VLRIGAPDCPVCHRTVSDAPGPYKCQPTTFEKTKARSAIIHWTVWCATGQLGEPAEQWLSAHSGRLWQVNSARKSQSSEVWGAPDCPVWHRTVWCRKRTKLQRSTLLRTLTVGWRGGALDSAQYLSDGTPDYPVRPSPAASPMATNVVGGYKYPPTTTTFDIQVFWRSHSIQEL